MTAASTETLVRDVASSETTIPAVSEVTSGAEDTVATTPRDNTSPGTLERPAYLMNCPFSFSANEPNNAWMRELDDAGRTIDRTAAMRQFAQLYDYMTTDAFVFLLPTPADCQLQDLVFTANLGLVLEHLPQRDIVVLSNFATEPRVGETEVGQKFFRAMGYTTVVAPYKFEGEAELKHLHDNVYVGGYGIRSDRQAYEWMEAEFDMEVIKIKEADEYLYHLDCSIFPITADDTLVCTKLLDPAEVARIEKATNIIDVSADACYTGICNSVRHHQAILNSSHIHSLRAGSQEYFEELRKNRELEDIAVRLGLEVNYFNLSEYHKGGALLSCMVMHLNRRSYSFTLV